MNYSNSSRLFSLTKLLAMSLGLAVTGLASSATAATYTWDPTLNPSSPAGGAGTWSTANANWSNGTSDTLWNDTTGTADTAVFSGVADAVTLDSNLGARGLQFLTTGYTISGAGTLTLGSGGINASTLTSGTTTIGNSLALVGGYQQWLVGSGGKLAINGAVTRSLGASVNLSTTGITSSSLVNNSAGILGGWATMGNSGASAATADWATVDGSGNLTPYTGYTLISNGTGSSQTLSAATESQNWKAGGSNGSVTTLLNSGTVSSLVVQGDVVVGAGNTLTLGNGGLILNGISRWIKGPNGTSSDTGRITSGLASGELFVDVPSATSDANNWRIWTKIVDNAGTAVSVVKNGPGFVELANSNTYTGNTYLNAGTLGAGISGALGSGALYLNGGTLTNYGAGAQVDLANNIVVSGNNAIQLALAGGSTIKNMSLSGTMSGSGSLTLGNDGNNSSIYVGLTNMMTSGTITLANNTNSVRLTSTAAGNPNVAWVFNNTGANRDTLDFGTGTISFGSLTGNGTLRGNSSGTHTLSVGALGLNETFSGTLVDQSGVIAVVKTGTGAWTLSGANTYTGGSTINQGTLTLGNAAALSTTAGGISFGGGALQYGSGITTDYSARIAAGTSASPVAINTNGNNVTFATALTANQSGGLTKSGSGTLTLGANNAYTGVTTINGGTLKVTGTIGSTGGVLVNSGATLSGSGLVSGTTTVGVGGILTNGNGNTAALSLGGLTFSGAGGTVNLNTAGSAGLNVAGSLATNGSGVTLNVTTAPAWANGTTYNLISYGSFSGALSDFVKGSIAGLGARQSATLGDSGTAITLAIAGDTPVWTGAASDAWTATPVGSPYNWNLQTQGTGTEFLVNDQVLFDDNATGSTSVNISDANVAVASVAFNNSAKDYVIRSTGGFGIVDGSGAAALVKSGTGKVTLTTTNAYTGPTTINAGTLELGDGTTNGDIASSSSVTNNGTLAYNRAGGTFTYANAISGTGSVIKTGSGTQILAGANSYSGGTTISSGTLQVGNGGTTGSLGTGAVANDASLVFNRSNSVSQGTDFGTISGTGSVTQAGTGTVTLSSANSYSGGTQIKSGIVAVGNNSGLGTGDVSLNGGTLNNAAGVGITNNIVVGANGGAIGIGADADFTLSGTLSGAGNINLNSNGFVRSVNWNFAANTMTSGTVTLASGGNNTTVFRFNSPAATSAALDWVIGGASDRGVPIGAAGTYEFGSLAGTGKLWGNFQPNTTNIALSVGGNNHDATFSGLIADNGPKVSVSKVGSGKWTLAGANTYTGVTTIASGTLALTSAGSINNSATIDVQSGATFDVSAKTGFAIGASQTLKGKGTLLGSVSLNGTVAPGESAGTLSVTGDFTLASTAMANFELQSGDVTIGNNINDLIAVGGALTLDGTLNITEVGGSLANGTTYTLFTYTGGLTNNGLDLSTAFLTAHPGSLIDVGTAGQVNLLVVPEPSSVGMIFGGIGALLAFRRRR